ncbi:MAG: hypothetical protein ABIZ80_16020, partial [Bryobacteraceae bacterium]
ARVRRYTILGAVCGLATLINPFGYRLHLHVLDYMRAGFISDLVDEFQSPRFRGENMLQFELLLFAALIITGFLLKEERWVEALLILFWAQAALGSARHIPIFAIVAAPMVAEKVSGLWDLWVLGKPRQSLAGVFADLSADFGRLSMRTTFWAPVALASVAMISAESLPANFSDKKFPVSMVDRQSARLLGEGGKSPRVFTSDQWGDYLTYHFYPRMKIFFDGRSDFFGPEFVKDYVKLAGAQYGWEKVLDKNLVDVALIPVGWPLAELLKNTAGWKVVADDGVGILFERSSPGLMKRPDSAERLAQPQIRGMRHD